MNYRHGYHAGNFADVVKHLALVGVMGRLARKDAPFAVIDSHAGRGRYDLASAEARKTGEAAAGIGRLRDVKDGSALLDRYLALVRESGSFYPGSPLLAARLLRPQDRLVAIEKHPQEAALLKEALAPWRKAHAEAADGYRRLGALLPPPERRGLILIDPPFEAEDEFLAMAGAVRAALRRFANGIYLLWFPVKSESEADRFAGEILASGASKVLRIDATVAAREGKLARAGILLVNPPYGLDADMKEALDKVAPLLGAKAEIKWLKGE